MALQLLAMVDLKNKTLWDWDTVCVVTGISWVPTGPRVLATCNGCGLGRLVLMFSLVDSTYYACTYATLQDLLIVVVGH